MTAPHAGARPVAIRRALISVSDKSGLIEFARALVARGIVILSTGGSAAALSAAGIAVTEVATHTGFPEMMDGRLKTLHPLIHGGILARRDDAGDRAAMAAHGIAPIDLVVVNLYPFEATVVGGAPFDACVEQIDIGGPALLRGAAKNHADVAVVVEPADYAAVLAELAAHDGATTLVLRRRLAAAAFARVAAYDALIAAWMEYHRGELFPERMVGGGVRARLLRYGENPHQRAALYVGGPLRPGVAGAALRQGKELSYNNIADADAALELAAEFAGPAAVIVKHANPCGVALGPDIAGALAKAWTADPVSAYGGVIALNRPLDGAAAALIARHFVEVVIAPEADAAALAALAHKRDLRVLVTGQMPQAGAPGLALRSVAGGFLVQDRDAGRIGAGDLRVVSRRAPSAEELADLLFAWSVVKHVRSNAIVYARGGATMGIGAGQMSRVDAARLGAAKAKELAEAAGETASRAAGAVVASDAFFPFADGLEVAAVAGAIAAIQPGGSKRDAEVIAAADAHGMAMVFTGMRHFRH